MVKLERRRLPLKKPVVVAGLVLTLMLAAFAAFSMSDALDAHAAAPSAVGLHSVTARNALIAAKKKSKSATCSQSAHVYVYPCIAQETMNGQISFALYLKHLNPLDYYYVYADTLDYACAGNTAITGTSLQTDLAGNANLSFTTGNTPGFPCVVPAKNACYAIQVQDYQTPYTVYQTKLCVKIP